MAPFLKPPTSLSIKQLKKAAKKIHGAQIVDQALTRPDLEALVTSKHRQFNLIANVVHASRSGEFEGSEGGKDPLLSGSYLVQARDKEEWFELQDLFVSEFSREQVLLSEAYMLVYEASSASIV